MDWKTVKRPGFFGKERDAFYKKTDEKYGRDNWRIVWQWNGAVLPFITACQLYEDGYYADSHNRERLWKELASSARDVYDHQESDVQSGWDYTIQNGTATHLQDIAIRKVMLRRGIKFQGDKLVQVRQHESYWGQRLSPGKVPFHEPELIVEPHLVGWWDVSSIEDFWQSNKVLQVRDKQA